MRKVMHSLPSPEDIVIHDLPNGIRLLMRQNHYAESTTCLGYLTTGGISDPDEKLVVCSLELIQREAVVPGLAGGAVHDLDEGVRVAAEEHTRYDDQLMVGGGVDQLEVPAFKEGRLLPVTVIAVRVHGGLQPGCTSVHETIISQRFGWGRTLWRPCSLQ